MDVDELRDVLAQEGSRFAAAIERGDPGAPVPTCPGWTLRDLVHHTGGVHRWATRIVGEPRTEPLGGELEAIAGGWPADEDLVAWFRAGHALLVDALRHAPEDLDCWAFLRAPSALAMWSRRQAHETAIHRVDAELASGPATPIQPRFAADGVDELLSCFLPRSSSKLRTDVPRRIGLVATDTGDRWTVSTSDAPPAVERAGGDADVVVRAPAAELYLLAWNRRDPDGLDVEGDAALLEQWRRQVTIRFA